MIQPLLKRQIAAGIDRLEERKRTGEEYRKNKTETET